MNNTFDNLSKKTPAEIANRLLEDVLENKDIERWKALRLFKSYALSEHSEVTVSSVRQVLSFLLEELRKENRMYADILKKVYWDEVKSVDVKIYFDEKYDYSPSSNSYYTKLKEARTKYGNLLLKYQNEDISNELKGNGSRYSHQPSETTTVSTLMPLTSSQRQRIRNATTVLALGITLFRFLAVFQKELREMVANGGRLQILLVNPYNSVIELASLRSESEAPVEVQKKRVEDQFELLGRWKESIEDADIELRLTNYFPPYGITMILPKSNPEVAQCLVRLYTFKSSTTTAPSINPHPIQESFWFDFFHDQFNKMWEDAVPYKFE